LYVSQSVSWLTFLLKLDKYGDISSSLWDIFLKFFGGIPGMFVHLFQIILNFMYVCQSVSWLTSLLKLYKSRIIYSSVWDIFLNFFRGIHGMFLHQFQIILNFLYVCQSISWHAFLLKLDKLDNSILDSSIWDIFLRHSLDVCTLVPNYSEFNICLSVW